ncbi:MAG: hypothetical protein PHD05_00800 [Sphaerochaetaceae bacterium]|nr:hypothetical protein [Sphaerochaetaceae bacterium]
MSIYLSCDDCPEYVNKKCTSDYCKKIDSISKIRSNYSRKEFKFPKSNDDKWLIDLKFLKQVAKRGELRIKHSIELECVEEILLAAESLVKSNWIENPNTIIYDSYYKQYDNNLSRWVIKNGEWVKI